MIKRALAAAALALAAAGAAYFAYRYLRGRQPERDSLPGGYVPRPLPTTGLSPAPVAVPAEVGIEAVEPQEVTGQDVPGQESSTAEPESIALESADDDEPELPSAAELEAEESLAEAVEDQAVAEPLDEPHIDEEIELPGETGGDDSSPDMDEADLAEALLEEPIAAAESAPLEERAEADLWSPSSGGTQVDPVLAHFEALAASEDIRDESTGPATVEEEPGVPAESPVADAPAEAEDAPLAEAPAEAEDVTPSTEPAEPQPESPPQPSDTRPAASEARGEAPLEDTAAADALLDEGNAYFNVGQFALAIQRYDRAIQLAPRLVAAFYNRANARTRIGDYDGAQSDYDTALGLNPTDADALNNRGMLHLYRGNHDAALQDFNLALGIDSRDGTVIVNRGLAYLHRGDSRGALSDFHEAIRLNSRDAAAHYGAAQSLASLGDTNAALMSLRNALRIEPSYAREAAAEPRFASLQSNDEFTRILRNPNG